MGGYWSSVPTLPADQHIVIVGAGYGGVALGLELLKHKANFTIISPRDCFHHNVGSLRASVQPGEFVDCHYGDYFRETVRYTLGAIVIMQKNYTALRCISVCLLLEISRRLYKWSGSW